MIAAFYGIEELGAARGPGNYVGMTWRRAAKSWTWRRFVPPMVPDDENLAMAPLFVRMYCYQVDPVTKLLTSPFAPDGKRGQRRGSRPCPAGGRRARATIHIPPAILPLVNHTI